MNSLTSKIKNLKSWLIDVRRDLHKTPELGLEEFLTNKRYIVVVDGDEYNCLRPKQSATRAEVASMLMRLEAAMEKPAKGDFPTKTDPFLK